MKRASAWLLSVVAAACVDVDFVEGVRCSNDRQCGRALECEQGFCGGCSELGVLPDGGCGCPGDRIFDCRVLAAAPYCMAVCPSQRDRCQVALVLEDGERQTLVACEGAEDPNAPCFTVEPTSAACSGGADEILVMAPDLAFTTIVANCPPLDDERFDCSE